MRNGRVIAMADFSLVWLVGSVVNFQACAVNEFQIQLVEKTRINFFVQGASGYSYSNCRG